MNSSSEKSVGLTILGVVAILAIIGLVLLFVKGPQETRVGEGKGSIKLSQGGQDLDVDYVTIDILNCDKFCNKPGLVSLGCITLDECETKQGDGWSQGKCSPDGELPVRVCCCKKPSASTTTTDTTQTYSYTGSY